MLTSVSPNIFSRAYHTGEEPVDCDPDVKDIESLSLQYIKISNPTTSVTSPVRWLNTRSRLPSTSNFPRFPEKTIGFPLFSLQVIGVLINFFLSYF